MALENVESIFLLSPVQEAALKTENIGAHCGRFSCDLRGNLNEAVFEAAWQSVVDACPALRAAFVWKRVEKPLQVVRKELKISVSVQDLRDLSDDQQQERLEAFLNDKSQQINPSEPPLIRLTLFRRHASEHSFVCVYHRLALDERSLLALINDAFCAYDLLASNLPAQIPQRRSMRDYLAWLKQQDSSQAETFWRERLDGFVPAPYLSIERAQTALTDAQPSFEQSHLSLSETTLNALSDLARDHRLSISTIAYGAWAILLNRYSGERDVIFGISSPGRPSQFDEKLKSIGCFENTLPLRVQVSDDEWLPEWLKSIEVQQSDLRRFQHNSLDQLREWSSTPDAIQLFNSCVTFDPEIAASRTLNSYKTMQIANVRVSDNPDVLLRFVYAPECEPALKIVYDARRFDHDAIADMSNHLQNLLELMALNPERRLAQLSILSQAERHRMLVEWNGTQKDYAEGLTISETFEAQAEKHPDAVAVIFGDEQLSYSQVNRRANQLAHHLKQLGVGPEVLVGMCLERSADTVVGMLGVLKAGGAFLPLDPTYPLDRLAYMIEDSHIAVLMTHERLIEGLPVNWTQVICIDADWETISVMGEENPVPQALVENLAYTIYTSGSTGRPKGVMVSHRGISNLANVQGAAFHIKPGSRVLQFASLSFDASISEVFVTLLQGGTLCLGAQEDLQPGRELIELLKAEAISTVTFPPSVLAALDKTDMPALENIVAAGEACSAEIVTKWAEGRRFINAYGPTEATVCATLTECTTGNGNPSIGHPIDNTQVYALDARMEPAPSRIAGEIFIGGLGLARGYLGRPELTAEKFLPNPFAQTQGERLYKTGDLGQLNRDGDFYYTGRTDHQVKVRGFRIELGEIQAVMAGHPRVKDCVVIARDETDGEKRIVAYVVEKDQDRASTGKFREYLRERLPEHMIPARFISLDALPLSGSGKVDRKALPEPDHQRSDDESEYEGPRNEKEETLAGIWASLLKIERVGINDNFFELGGHSLLATQLISRVREVFEVELTVRSLFNAPTIARLMSEIEKCAASTVAQTRPAIHASPRGNESLDQLLARLSKMSDSEARAILQNKNMLAKRRNGNE